MAQGKWVVLGAASNQTIAEGLRGMLVNEGIPCKLHPADAITFMGITTSSVRLMTTEPYLERARAILEAEEPQEPDQSSA